jgi:DNA-binding NarL/FixJ family response regulator
MDSGGGAASQSGRPDKGVHAMRVLLIDDHRLFREGVALLLRSLMQEIVISEAASCEEAMDQLAQSSEQVGQAELILMDLGLPGLSSLDGIALLRARYPDIPVVALAASEDLDTVLLALDAGAMGFIPKSSSAAILVQALHLVLAKGIYLPPSVFLTGRAGMTAKTKPLAQPAAERAETAAADGIRQVREVREAHEAREALEAHQSHEFHAAHEHLMTAMGKRPSELGLSPRQTEVLHLILQGKSNKLICRELALSLSTVKVHTSAVLRALHVTTRTQAVVMAAKLGLRFDNPTELDS